MDDRAVELSGQHEEMLWGVFVAGCEGGINSWFIFKDYQHRMKEDSDVVPEGYTATGHAIDAKKQLTIDRSVVLRGFSVVLEGVPTIGRRPYADTHQQIKKIRLAWTDPDAYGDIDADGADILIQLGLFGDVVYG